MPATPTVTLRIVTLQKTVRLKTPKDASVGQLKAAIAAALGRSDVVDPCSDVKLSLRPAIARGDGSNTAAFHVAIDDFDEADALIAAVGIKKSGQKIYAVLQPKPELPPPEAVAIVASPSAAAASDDANAAPRSVPSACCAICGRDHVTSTLSDSALTTLRLSDINRDIEQRGLLQLTIELATYDNPRASRREMRRFPQQLLVCTEATCADLRERIAWEIPRQFPDVPALAHGGLDMMTRCDILTASAREQDLFAMFPALKLTDPSGPSLASFDALTVRENRELVVAKEPAVAGPAAMPAYGVSAKEDETPSSDSGGAAATKTATKAVEEEPATVANTPFVRSDLLLPDDVTVPDDVSSWSELKAWRDREFVKIVPLQRATAAGVRFLPSASEVFVHQDHTTRRVGFLFGNVDGADSATPGWVNVRAVYEPPQYGLRQVSVLFYISF